MSATQLILSPGLPELAVISAFWTPTEKAAARFLDFFTANIRNRHTRRAYLQAIESFTAFCEELGLTEMRQVKPLHVSAYIEHLTQTRARPTAKQHLAAVRMLFDWMVVGQVIEFNPAHAVRGPKHSVKKGKTPVLTAEEARALLDSIDTNTVTGLRDRALIGLMVYTFARVGAAIQMKVEDVYVQGRRHWVRLHEKGGKEHSLPCHHNLQEFLLDYIEIAGLKDQPKGPLFRTAAGRTDQITTRPMDQSAVYYMIGRRARLAGIETKIGCHTFRATGITAYLKNGGRLEVAQQMAAHESSRTTGLYDRRNDQVSLDEVERIVF